MMFRQVSAAVTLVLLATQAYAERKLYSNSLVNCMKNNTDIIPDYFNVVFDAEARSINYDISLTATLNGKLKAAATVYAFGFDVIHETIDLCKLNMKQFCPITPSHIEVQSVQYIDKSYVDKIPGIAYTFPDLDAVARLIILNQENEILGCLQASFNNGKTVAHEGVNGQRLLLQAWGCLCRPCFLSLVTRPRRQECLLLQCLSSHTFNPLLSLEWLQLKTLPQLLVLGVKTWHGRWD